MLLNLLLVFVELAILSKSFSFGGFAETLSPNFGIASKWKLARCEIGTP
jgi:hypothetical protein